LVQVDLTLRRIVRGKTRIRPKDILRDLRCFCWYCNESWNSSVR